MKKLSLYDPAMCCSSGVCGPSVDPVLVQLTSDLEWLKKQGVAVDRHNLSQQPADFAANDAVREALQQEGQDCLPLVFADGNRVASRFYPTREQFAKIFGLKIEITCCDSPKSPVAPGEGGGCCG